MEIQLINSEKFYITQQEEVLYRRYLGTYGSIEIESVNCPEFDNFEDILYLRGDQKHRNLANVKVPLKKMTKVLTALSLCCIDNGVTLTIKL